MKTLFTIYFFWSSASCTAQNFNHTVGITPYGCFYNKGFFLAHGVAYKFGFKRNSLFVSTEGTVFKNLDARKRYSSFDKFIPFLNQSTFQYGRELFNLRNDKCSNKIEVLIGYQFFQHGSRPDLNYWYVDSLENGGVRVLSGFQTHSVSIGAKWSNSTFKDSYKENNTLKSKNTIELNYLLGLGIRLKGFNEFGANQQDVVIANTYQFNRNGIRLAYKYERFITKHTSLYAQLDLLYVPFIEYTPNKKIVLPRGGERISPFFPSLKVGINLFTSPNTN